MAALTEKQCVATFGVKNGDSVVVDIAIEDIIASLSPLVYEEDALLAKASELYSPFLVQSAPASKTGNFKSIIPFHCYLNTIFYRDIAKAA